MPPEFGGKCGTEVYQWEQTLLTLGSQFPSAYPATCGKQREAKIKAEKNLLVTVERNQKFISILELYIHHFYNKQHPVFIH